MLFNFWDSAVWLWQGGPLTDTKACSTIYMAEMTERRGKLSYLVQALITLLTLYQTQSTFKRYIIMSIL